MKLLHLVSRTTLPFSHRREYETPKRNYESTKARVKSGNDRFSLISVNLSHPFSSKDEEEQWQLTYLSSILVLFRNSFKISFYLFTETHSDKFTRCLSGSLGLSGYTTLEMGGAKSFPRHLGILLLTSKEIFFLPVSPSFLLPLHTTTNWRCSRFYSLPLSLLHR